jgi:hypothetical protein
LPESYVLDSIRRYATDRAHVAERLAQIVLHRSHPRYLPTFTFRELLPGDDGLVMTEQPLEESESASHYLRRVTSTNR